MSSLSGSKASSLRWAIDELSKQKEELSSKISVAHKREETSSLIEEVNAQKESLEQRISSLKEGLKATAQLVHDSVDSLEDELSKVDGKLDIAQDRLNSLEQEEYLEELGRKLNGDFSTEETEIKSKTKVSSLEIDSADPFTVSKSSDPQNIDPTNPMQPLSDSSPVLMKSPTNRIEVKEEIDKENTSRVTSSEIVSIESEIEQCSSLTIKSLEECASALGIEPEFLLNKGIQSVLRMIARNGNKISFPLEVEQVEKS